MRLAVNVSHAGIVLRRGGAHAFGIDGDPLVIPRVLMLPFAVCRRVDKQLHITVRQRFLRVPVNHCHHQINRLPYPRFIRPLRGESNLRVRRRLGFIHTADQQRVAVGGPGNRRAVHMYGSVVAAHLIFGRRPVFGIVRRRPAGVRCQRTVLMSHLHQLFGVRQNIAMVIGAVPVEQRPGFVGIDDAFVSAARFRRQLRAGEGVGYTVQRRGGALHHMAVHTGLIAVRTGDGGENDVDIVGQRGIVLRRDDKSRFYPRTVLLRYHHRGVALPVRYTMIFCLRSR